ALAMAEAERQARIESEQLRMEAEVRAVPYADEEAERFRVESQARIRQADERCRLAEAQLRQEIEARAIAEQARIEAESLDRKARDKAEMELLEEFERKITEAEFRAQEAESRARETIERLHQAEVKLQEETEARAIAEQAAIAEPAEAGDDARAAVIIQEEPEQGRFDTEPRIREVEERFKRARAGSQPPDNTVSTIHQGLWQMSDSSASVIALPPRAGAMVLAVNLFLKSRVKLLSYGVIILLLIVALVWVGATIYILLQGDA
ncbi:MAG TPA: hypothetical protein VJ810_41920, partial [Blastocatellia bacterium]|nr:hypothetical protein [Blastocatellia bacterium]